MTKRLGRSRKPIKKKREAKKTPRKATKSAGAGSGALQASIRRCLAELSELKKPDIEQSCKRLFAKLRKECPELLPQGPVRPGEEGPRISLDSESAGKLLRLAAYKVNRQRGRVVWRQAGNELEIKVKAGFILVRIPVDCDQTGPAKITITFAVGSDDRPSGMIAATSAQPNGPPEIVEFWGDALIALAWGSIAELSQSLGFESGEDVYHSRLVPASLVAARDGLHLQTMARHQMDWKRQ